ncbi:MAG: hypothetical protein LZF62_40037 [Nitrospira sp.]|nr:MAG: hypothetical protein LZF62_40037 [Nitrospira sp.]
MTTGLPTSRIWGIPIAIGVVSAVGLLSALLGDGLWDALSWITLTIPIAVPLWYVVRSSAHARHSTS